MVSGGGFGERWSIPSGLRRSRCFPKLPPRFAKRARVADEPALGDRAAQLAHQSLVVVQVVQRVEPRAEDLVHLLQVVQVAPRKMGAGVAGAGFVERSRVVAVAGVADLDVAEARKQPAVAGVARR